MRVVSHKFYIGPDLVRQTYTNAFEKTITGNDLCNLGMRESNLDVVNVRIHRVGECSCKFCIPVWAYFEREYIYD